MLRVSKMTFTPSDCRTTYRLLRGMPVLMRTPSRATAELQKAYKLIKSLRNAMLGQCAYNVTIRSGIDSA